MLRGRVGASLLFLKPDDSVRQRCVRTPAPLRREAALKANKRSSSCRRPGLCKRHCTKSPRAALPVRRKAPASRVQMAIGVAEVSTRMFTRLPMLNSRAARQNAFAKLVPNLAVVREASTNPRLHNFRITWQSFAMHSCRMLAVTEPHLLNHCFVFAPKISGPEHLVEEQAGKTATQD